MQQPETDSGFQKYVFKASAAALTGSIRKPYFQDLGTHAAISTYAGSSGEIAATSRGFRLGDDVSYEAAVSEIRAERNGQTCQVVAKTTITNLRVGKRFAVDEVVCRLRSVYDIRTFPERKTPRISPAGSSIRGLRIDGEIREVKLPPAFSMEPNQEEEFLLGRLNGEQFYPGYFPEPFYVTGLGTIFAGEWTWVHPQERHRQSIRMLRLALGSHFGAAIDVCVVGSDGNGWPPYGL